MAELQDLYQELIIDHGRRPRNQGEIDNATFVEEGFNPLCGDKVKLYCMLVNNIIKDIKFNASGCAISVASASIMSEILKGKTVQQAQEFFKAFQTLVTTGESEEDLGKCEVFAGVAQYPMRVKCATLVWHAMQAGLKL